MTMAWLIDEWPTIEITQEGDERCTTTAAAKQESKQWKKVVISALVLAKSRSEGSSGSQPVRKIRTLVHFTP